MREMGERESSKGTVFPWKTLLAGYDDKMVFLHDLIARRPARYAPPITSATHASVCVLGLGSYCELSAKENRMRGNLKAIERWRDIEKKPCVVADTPMCQVLPVGTFRRRNR